jgi:Ca2+:H+ antiporter
MTSGPSSRRPKSSPSYRHSTAGPSLSSSHSSRRRRSHAGPGSTRSSVRLRSRSSDIEEEDESASDESDERYLGSRPSHSNMRRASSRRSVRLHPDDEYDVRSFDGRDPTFAGGSDDGIEDGDSDMEPLTLKDRQEV